MVLIIFTMGRSKIDTMCINPTAVRRGFSLGLIKLPLKTHRQPSVKEKKKKTLLELFDKRYERDHNRIPRAQCEPREATGVHR